MREDKLIIKHLIPVTPGFFALWLLRDEQGEVDGWSKEPIVGWALDQFDMVCPVTPVAVEGSASATLNPDGTVVDLIGSWQTIESWFDSQRAPKP